MRTLAIFLLSAFVVASCASGPQYKMQDYAKLANSKVFEEEYSVVWNGIMAALSEYTVQEKNMEKGFVQTDWIYSTSTEKYVDYSVNGFPRKKYLQTRYKFRVSAEKQVGGIKVTINSLEEVENLKSDGTSEGWKEVSEPDSSRQNELLNTIENKIHGRLAVKLLRALSI